MKKRDYLSKSLYDLNEPKDDFYFDDYMKPVPVKRRDESMPKPMQSAHEIVRTRNAEDRINELERTNTQLKRMLDSVLKSTKDGERIKTAAPRLLIHREIAESKLGPPM